jgi:hypothetical protein
MPVTPLHIGPALIVKAVVPHHFSVLVFAFGNVLMDIEPAVQFLREEAVLHGSTHTYLGATILGFVSLFLGKPFCEWLLARFQADPRSPFLVWLHGPDHIGWRTAAISALAATYSHVVLDSIMHGDMEPLAPWSRANGLLAAVPVDTLNLLCVGNGLLGAALLAVAFLLRTPSAPKGP